MLSIQYLPPADTVVKQNGKQPFESVQIEKQTLVSL